MKKSILKQMLLFALVIILFSSCVSTNKIMLEPNVRVNMDMDDFILSDQVWAEASSTKIIGIDWAKLFKLNTGNVQRGRSQAINFTSTPVVGPIILDQTANFALYQLMLDNPGYDVVYYPQYECSTYKPLGFGIIYHKTYAKVTARLGKMKN